MKQTKITRVLEIHKYHIGHFENEAPVIVACHEQPYGMTRKQILTLMKLYPNEQVLKHEVTKQKFSLPTELFVEACINYAKQNKGE